MADVLAKCLTKWGIENKVMSIVCNNASNNDKMVESLATHQWQFFWGSLGRVRCFAHC
jgi:hypothetical protein